MKIAILHKKILFSCICICGLRCSPPVIGRGRRYFFEDKHSKENLLRKFIDKPLW